MVCERCNGPLGASRDPICLGCAAVSAIEEELRSEWPSASVRAIGTDLLVSCSRHIRALRITTGRAYAEAETKGRLEERAAHRDAEECAEAEKQGVAIKEEEDSYSYTGEEDEEPPERHDRSRTPAGVAAKTKASPATASKEDRGTSVRPRSGKRGDETPQDDRRREALPRAHQRENRNLRREGREPVRGHTSTRRRSSRVDLAEAERIQLHQRRLGPEKEESDTHRPSRHQRWRRRK